MEKMRYIGNETPPEKNTNPNRPKSLQEFVWEHEEHKQLLIDFLKLIDENEKYWRGKVCEVTGKELTNIELQMQRADFFNFVSAPYFKYASYFQLELALRQDGLTRQYYPTWRNII